MRQILIIDAHPAATSLCSAMVQAYSSGASRANADLREIHLRDLDFDPILHEGYKQRQDWEPDLQKTWQAIKQADHLCFVYPTWWGGHPALLQGFLERVFLPGKVFKFHEKGMGWDKLLQGKTADLITTMDTPLWYYRLAYRNSGIHRMKKTIMEFTGVKTKVCAFGNVRNSSREKREKWLQKVTELGARAA